MQQQQPLQPQRQQSQQSLSDKPKKYIQVHKAALRIDCDPRCIRGLILQGELEAIRIGPRGLRISVESLEKFIQQKAVDPDTFFADKVSLSR